jgi:hypothetical protein
VEQSNQKEDNQHEEALLTHSFIIETNHREYTKFRRKSIKLKEEKKRTERKHQSFTRRNQYIY